MNKREPFCKMRINLINLQLPIRMEIAFEIQIVIAIVYANVMPRSVKKKVPTKRAHAKYIIYISKAHMRISITKPRKKKVPKLKIQSYKPKTYPMAMACI